MFELPPLPFDKSALEPHMSERTLSYHYDKHHAGYVKKLNDALDGDKRLDLSLEEVIHGAARNDDTNVFRNAAQTWNHTFFWNSLSADGGGDPDGAIAEMIEKDFGRPFRRPPLVNSAAAGPGWCSTTAVCAS